MTRILAPEGVVSFSHSGHTFEVGEDGTLDVAEHVVDDAKSHGFTVVGDGAATVSATISVNRDSVLKVLEAMGVAANPAMRADKLAAAFEGAAARVQKPKAAETKTPETKPDGKDAAKDADKNKTTEGAAK